MNLPSRNQRHKYEAQLSNQIVKFTPWLVKDEQEYMYAVEGLENESEVINHIEELLSKCVDIDFDSLTDVDFLKLAIEIRKKSKGSEHEVVFTCRNCNHINADNIIDLEEDVIETRSDIKEPIQINDLEFNIKSLSRKELSKLKNIEGEEKKKWAFIVYSIKSIAVGDELFTNLSEEDIGKFIGEELENDEFKELINGIGEYQDSIAVESKFQCEKCGAETLVYVDKITDFFV